LASIAIVLAATLAAPALAQAALPTASMNAPPTGAQLDEAAEKVYRAGVFLSGAVAPPPTVLVVPAPPPLPVAPQPPAAPTAQTTAVAQKPEMLGGFFLALDFETLGFFEKVDHVSPIPEIVVGLGDETFRMALFLSTYIGSNMGYGGGLRFSGGTRAAPVGYNLGIDVEGVAVSAPPGTAGSNGQLEKGTLGEVGGTFNAIDLTYRAGPVLLVLHVLSVGYFYVPNTNGQAFAIGGGLAASWFP
jgi:hypothetical protein